MKKTMDGKSYDNIQARIEELKRLFPEVVKEGRFDPELLVGLLEEQDDTYGLNDERYDFTWKGKRESLKLAQRRSDGTLRPDFEESRDWDTTQNLYIEGDNLEVLKLLQQGYLRSVKMIYIDPPYNTGNDFVYQDDFADPIAKYKEATGQGMRANPETAGRYHSNWLSMMYPRLKIAKTLLRDDGVIFISIDDNEQANLKRMCDEIFGEENFLGNIIWQKKQSPQNDAVNLSDMHDFVVAYAKRLRTNRDDNMGWVRNLFPRDENDPRYQNPDNDPRGAWASGDLTCNKSSDERPNLYFPIVNPNTNEEIWPSKQRVWICEKATMQRLIDEKRLWWGESGRNIPRQKKYLSEVQNGIVPTTWWNREFASDNQAARREIRSLFPEKNGDFSYPKPTQLVKRMLQIASSADDTIMDFFSGSGTTADAVMQANAEDNGHRHFVCIQLPEPTESGSEAQKAGFANISDIGKERIRRAGDRLLQQITSGTGSGDGSGYGMGAGNGAGSGDGSGGDDEKRILDIGFRVFKLDSSNLVKWDGTYIPSENPDLFFQRAEHSLGNMKPDRRDIDMVYEVFLKYGVPLTEKLSTLKIQGKTFHVVGDTGYLMICLDKSITVEIVEETIKIHTPGAIIFADECFADDNELTNAGLVLDKAQVEFRWI